MFGSPVPLPILGFLAVHHALRSEAATVEQLASSGRERAAARRARLLGRVLRQHHHTEDELLWPTLLERSPELAGVVARLERDHLELDDLLDRVPDDLTLATRLRELLDEHLAAEEQHALPVWMTTLTPGEHERFGRALQRRTAWRDAGLMIAWLLDHAPDGAADVAMPHVPPTLRVAHKVWWRRRYEWQWGSTRPAELAAA